jgi:chaperone BCS1
MFSGPPGNGKSSTIQALASTFDLPIYILPVASASFSDSTLSRAVSKLTSKCILVLEDLDALSMKNTHRTPAATAATTADMDDAELSLAASWIRSKRAGRSRGRGRFRVPGDARSGGGGGDITDADFSERLSLSAILNVLDGIDSGEGRIVIASTNHLNFLQFDEALLRPGRFDLFIEFKKATKEQARDLFLQFYKDYKSKVEVLEKEILPDDEFTERLSLGQKEVNVLADEFKGMVQDEEFSVAALQGKNRTNLT